MLASEAREGEARAAGEAGGPSRALGLGVLAVLTVVLYGQTLGYGYTYYDDYPLLEQNRDFLRDPGNIPRAFTEDGFAYLGGQSGGLYYRPLLWVSFILEEQLAPGSVALRHGVNVLLHALVSCGAFVLLLRLGAPRGRALALALLFASHPTLVPAVAWIPGRNDLLLGFFALATWLALLSFLERERVTAVPGVVLAFALSLFTKESAIALAVLIPAACLAHLGRRAFAASLPRLLLAGGCAGIAALWMTMRVSALEGFPLFLSQVLANVPMSVVYVGKTLAPIGSSPMPIVTPLGLALGLAAVALVLGGVWHSRDRLFGPVGVGLLWYAAFLFPALLAPPPTRGLEHRLYVPMIGFLVALAFARWPARLLPPAAWRRAGLALVAAAFVGLSLARLPDYESPISFWRSAAETSRGSRDTLKNLAIHYFKADRLDEAEAACRRAISRNEGDAELRRLFAAIAARRAQLQKP